MHRKSTLLNLFVSASACLLISACVSGPFKINQSGTSAEVVDNRPQQSLRQTSYKVLIIPSGAVKTSFISDKTSTIGGFIGSMVVGPVAGIVGGVAGSTAGSTAASNAEEAASKNVDSQDVARAIDPIKLPVYFSDKLSDQLKECGIASTVYPQMLEPTLINWGDSHLNLPSNFRNDAASYRFFVQAGVTNINLRSGIKSDTLEGAAFVRVYETHSLKQIGRYSYKTGTTGSVTLEHYNKASNQQSIELAQAAKDVGQYLANGIATDMCTVMKRF